MKQRARENKAKRERISFNVTAPASTPNYTARQQMGINFQGVVFRSYVMQLYRGKALCKAFGKAFV